MFVADNDWFEVEKVLDKRTIVFDDDETPAEVQYFVKWKNYPDSENTWEPLGNLDEVMWMVQEYERRRQNG